MRTWNKEAEASQLQRDGGGHAVLRKGLHLITDFTKHLRKTWPGLTRSHRIFTKPPHPAFSRLLLPSSKPSLKDPDLLMVRVFSSSDMQEFLRRLSQQGSIGASWLVRLLLRRPPRLIWADEVGLDAVKMIYGDVKVGKHYISLLLICLIKSYKIVTKDSKETLSDVETYRVVQSWSVFQRGRWGWSQERTENCWLSPEGRWWSGSAANHGPPRGLAAVVRDHTYRMSKTKKVKPEVRTEQNRSVFLRTSWSRFGFFSQILHNQWDDSFFFLLKQTD